MHQCQRGFSIIEMILVTALASVISIWAASAWVQRTEDAASEAMGRWLLGVKHSVDHMLVRQADILTGLAVPTANEASPHQDIWQPEITELIRAGHLPRGFSVQAPLPYDLTIKVLRPAGLCSMVGCKIEALTIARPRLTYLDQANHVNRIGKILQILSGQAGSVTSFSSQRVRGATFDLPNPPHGDLQPLPVGSLVVRSFYDSTVNAAFLRQGERRHVKLADELSVAGAISAGKHIHAAGAISSSGRISSEQHLRVGAKSRPSEACAEEGLIAQSSDTGLLVCQGGVWQSGIKKSEPKDDGTIFLTRNGGICFKAIGMDGSDKDVWSNCGCKLGYDSVMIASWRSDDDQGTPLATYICVKAAPA
jgi:prepilin-type N-terminal cleavage/methylation domain-containing protein